MGVSVLVTGAGGPAGVAVLRALRSGGFRCVAADADPSAVGLRLADEAAVVPRADDDTFVGAVCDLALRVGADALVSTVAEEMGPLTAASRELMASGVAVWLPDVDAVRTCVDKWRFAEVMERHGIPVPASALGASSTVPGPWVVKPRFGRGSRDVYAVDDEGELAWAIRRVPEPLVQTRLTGREFTVDCLVDRDGELVGAVPRWRLEVKAGISTKGVTFEDQGLVRLVAELLGVLELRGPANVQGFLDEDGIVSFVEVNPRFSGGLPLALASGADLVGEYLRGVLGRPIRPERLTFRAGVLMSRFFEEVFEG